MSEQGQRALPLLARFLIGILAGPLYRDHVLGDLQEELHLKGSASQSRLWIWQQVFAAIPGLVILRTHDLDLRSIAVTTLLTLVAYGLLVLLGQNVTRPILMSMRDSFSGGPSWDYLYFYMLVRLPGVFLVGALFALVAYRPSQSSHENFARRLAPLLLVLILPQIWFIVAADQIEFVAGRIIRAVADGVVLYAGAGAGFWLKLRLSDK